MWSTNTLQLPFLMTSACRLVYFAGLSTAWAQATKEGIKSKVISKFAEIVKDSINREILHLWMILFNLSLSSIVDYGQKDIAECTATSLVEILVNKRLASSAVKIEQSENENKRSN